MRTAKAADHWRRVYERQYSFKINNLNYTDLKGIGSGSIIFNGGITALCGTNGVGKTTILKAVLNILTSHTLIDKKWSSHKMGEANFVGNITVAAKEIIRNIKINSEDVEMDPQSLNIKSVCIDSAKNALNIVNLFSNMTNIEEMLEGEGAKLASKDELNMVSYVVGKCYTKCETYEIDLANYGIVPYFKVESEHATYGSETMGLGELSAHYIFWLLESLEKNSILLLEEPESFLAPRAQSALLDVIAKISEERKIWVILTTHSPAILRSIPPQHIRLLARVGDGVEVITPENQKEYLQILGIKQHKSGAIFVEDRAAREYVKCWLGRISPTLLQEYEIIDIGSKENIIQQLSVFPIMNGLFKIYGLFDGDQRGEVTEEYRWGYSFLPGQEPPEIKIMNLTKVKRAEVAAAVGRDISKVNVALATLDGVNHHDWLVEFPRLIGLGYEQFISYMFNLVMTDEPLRIEAENAFKELEQIIFKK